MSNRHMPNPAVAQTDCQRRAARGQGCRPLRGSSDNYTSLAAFSESSTSGQECPLRTSHLDGGVNRGEVVDEGDCSLADISGLPVDRYQPILSMPRTRSKWRSRLRRETEC